MKTPFFASAALRASALLLGITVLSSAARLVAATAPILAAPTLRLATGVSSTLGATVISDGGSPILKRGILTVNNFQIIPTLGDSSVREFDDAAATTGAFTETTPVTGGVNFTFVAFATNSVGTTYTSPIIYNTDKALVVNTTSDSGTGSLRAAITLANTNEFVVRSISFDPTVFATPQTITLLSSLPVITEAINIQGPGGGLVTISGGNGIQPFLLGYKGIYNASFVISGLTIANASMPDSFGGAISSGSDYATLVVSNCVFTNNSAPTVSGQSGGGAIFYNGPLYIDNCTFSGCAGEFGGAVDWSPSFNTEISGAPVVISNSTFTGNSNGGGGNPGGALYVADAQIPAVINCTFYGNSGGYGSAIYTPAQPIFIENCTVSGNTASGDGAIFTYGDATLVNCIVSGNASGFDACDVYGASSTSSNNLIGVVLDGGLTNGTNGNIVGVNNPLLSAPGNYGGAVETMAVLPGSPAIGGGTPTGAPPLDERGVAYALTPDIGAFQSQGFSLSITSGNNQSASVGDAFTHPLVVTVTANAANDPVNGGVVDFAAPDSGASLNPASGSATISSGSASYSATANTAVGGPYTVTADTEGASSGVNFTLTNDASTPSSMVANTGTTPQSALVEMSFTNALAVTVTDANSNPVSGVCVTFTAPASGASGTFSNKTRTIMLTTNSFGVASAPFTANGAAGSYTVTAASKGLTTVDFSLTNATATPTALQAGTTATLDRQTGLFDFTVNVTNTTASAINGFRLFVNYSAYRKAYPTMLLYNATSTATYPNVYIDYPYPVALGSTVTMHLAFYTNNRLFPNPFLPQLSVTDLSASETYQNNPTGVKINTVVKQTDGSELLEFSSVPGRWYRIYYSSNGSNQWYASPIPIEAASTVTQWIDNGAPLTECPPSSVKSRLYYVTQIATP